MSKQWNPGRKAVELRPSRIRREPPRPEKKVLPPSREEEIFGGVSGVLLFTLAIAIVIIGVSIATYRKASDDPGETKFGQCYNSSARNCVLDGDTIYLAGEKMEIAGMQVPAVRGGQCAEEGELGINAAVRLAELLNSGKPTLGATEQGADGVVRQHIEVGGRDVARTMIKEGLAHESGSRRGWCQAG